MTKEVTKNKCPTLACTIADNIVKSTMATGYDNDFLESNEDYECPLCLHVTRDPTLTSCCGQHFCQACINRILTEQKPCPCCKHQGFNVFLDKKQKRRVLERKVYCLMKEQGCQWIGELSQLGTHLDANTGTCDYTNVSCPKQCGEVVQKNKLDWHLTTQCPKRDFSCKHCGYESTFEAVTAHFDNCPKYPVYCPNKCKVDSLERQELKQHIKQCPLQMVECEYAGFGCKEKTKRQQMTEHLDQNIQTHLSLVSQQLLEAHQKINEDQREIQSLKERVSSIEISSMLPPVELKVYKSSMDTSGKDLILYTHPGGYKFKFKCELTSIPMLTHQMLTRQMFTLSTKVSHVKTENDAKPVTYTIQVTVFNQVGNTDHLTRSQDLSLTRDDGSSTEVTLIFNDNPPETQYVKGDAVLLKINILVPKLKQKEVVRAVKKLSKPRVVRKKKHYDNVS